MQGSLGEKIGEGVWAEVHAWAPNQVVKLFRPNVPIGASWFEAHMTQIAFAAGAPSPKVFGVRTIEGRFAMMMQRFDGPTLLQLTRTGAVARTQAGAILASLFRAVHAMKLPPEVPDLRSSIETGLQREGLPAHVAPGVRALLDRLSRAEGPGEDGLCHGDLHPGNVIMTAEGPRLIDWIGVVRAPPAFDLACATFLLAEIAPQYADDPERPRAIAAALQSEYARLAGMDPAVLAAAIESWMPIVHVRALGSPGMSGQRERLLQRVEASLAGQAKASS